jgi:hypothetical protein
LTLEKDVDYSSTRIVPHSRIQLAITQLTAGIFLERPTPGMEEAICQVVLVAKPDEDAPGITPSEAFSHAKAMCHRLQPHEIFSHHPGDAPAACGCPECQGRRVLLDITGS